MILNQTITEENCAHSKHPKRIEILFEFSVPKPKLTFYQAVKAVDGSFRMQKRGEHAKNFRPIMWCGSEESLFKFREATEIYFRK